MFLELFFKLGLVLFIDEADHLQILFGFMNIYDFASVDLARIGEPDCAVVIFSELTFHLENFDIMHLLNVIAHFKALLHTVPVVIMALNQVNVLTT
jgi:hypothetical protein